MKHSLLKDYLLEFLLHEARLDRDFIRHLKNSSGLGHRFDAMFGNVSDLAERWLTHVEELKGEKLPLSFRNDVHRYVAQRLPPLMRRFGGDSSASEDTMVNLLNTRFSSWKK